MTDHDGLDELCEAVEWAIERLETPRRPDGTYNYSRAAIAQRLAAALKEAKAHG